MHVLVCVHSHLRFVYEDEFADSIQGPSSISHQLHYNTWTAKILATLKTMMAFPPTYQAKDFYLEP